MEQIIRELKRQLAGEKLTPGQLKGLACVLSSTNFRAAAPQHLSRQILSPRAEKRSQSTETGSHSGRWPSSGCTSRSPSRGAGIGIITSAPVGVVGAAVVPFAWRMWPPFQRKLAAICSWANFVAR
jgi:hypothetical protein